MNSVGNAAVGAHWVAPVVATVNPVFRSPATADDWDAARELLSEYLRLPDGWPHHQPPAVLPGAMTRYLNTFPQPGCMPPAGTVLLSFSGTTQPSGLLVVTDLDQPHAHLARLYVRHAARRTGIGRALVTEAIHLATAARCQTLVLDVLPTRCAAIDLYRSVGFQLTTAPDQNPNGVVFMARDVCDQNLRTDRQDRPSRQHIGGTVVVSEIHDLEEEDNGRQC